MSTLPDDCIEQICYQIANDITTLHSCVLINRRWCSTAISFLWQEPFRIQLNETGLKKIIDIYIRFLSSEQKIRLDLRSLLNSENCLFYYPCFLRALDILVIKKAIDIWVEKAGIVPNRVFNEIGRLIVHNSPRLREIQFGPQSSQLNLF